MIKAEFLKRYKLMRRGNYFGFFIDRLVAAFFIFIFPLTIYKGSGSFLSDEYTTLYGEIEFIDYIILSAAIFTFGVSMISSISKSYLSEMRQGTYIDIVISPVSNIKYFMGVIIYQTVFSLLEFSIIIVIGSFISSSLLSLSAITFVNLLVMIYSFIALSVVISFIVISIRDSYIVISTVEYILLLLCGIIFPYQFLPSILQRISLIIPITQSVENLRLSVFDFESIIFIVVYSSVWLFVGIFGNSWIEKRIVANYF